MRPRNVFLVAVVGCCSTAASGSVAKPQPLSGRPVPPMDRPSSATAASVPTSDDGPIDGDGSNETQYKNSDDWWKDPWALFEEDEEEEEEALYDDNEDSGGVIPEDSIEEEETMLPIVRENEETAETPLPPTSSVTRFSDSESSFGELVMPTATDEPPSESESALPNDDEDANNNTKDLIDEDNNNVVNVFQSTAFTPPKTGTASTGSPVDDLEERLLREYERLEEQRALEDEEAENGPMPTTTNTIGQDTEFYNEQLEEQPSTLFVPEQPMKVGDMIEKDGGVGETIAEIVEPVEVEPGSESADRDPTQIEEEFVLLSDEDVSKVLREQGVEFIREEEEEEDEEEDYISSDEYEEEEEEQATAATATAEVEATEVEDMEILPLETIEEEEEPFVPAEILSVPNRESQLRPEPKTVEPKPELRSQPKLASNRVEPKLELRSQPRPESKTAEPKPESRSQPRPEPEQIRLTPPPQKVLSRPKPSDLPQEQPKAQAQVPPLSKDGDDQDASRKDKIGNSNEEKRSKDSSDSSSSRAPPSPQQEGTIPSVPIVAKRPRKQKDMIRVVETPFNGEVVSETEMKKGFGVGQFGALVPSIPKIQNFLSKTPFARILAVAVVAKAVVDPIVNWIRRDKSNEDEDNTMMGTNDVDKDIELMNSRDEAIEEELTLKERRKQEAREARESRRRRKEEERQARRERHENSVLESVPASWIRRVLTGTSERLPSSRLLMEEVDKLKHDIGTVSRDKESIEREYERTSSEVSRNVAGTYQTRRLLDRTGVPDLVFARCPSTSGRYIDRMEDCVVNSHCTLASGVHRLVLPVLFHLITQLQEAQTDLASMQSTTRYLKAQLRDNEEIMNRAIDAERRKARGELMRMKDAMLSILERERKAMRDEVMRQSTHIQAMIRNTTETGTAKVTA